MKEFANACSFDFDCVVGLIDDSRIDVEGIDFEVVFAFQEKEKAVERIFAVFLLCGLEVVAGGYQKYIEFVDEFIAFEEANEGICFCGVVCADLCYFAAIDIIEVDEDGVVIYFELVVAAEGGDADEISGCGSALVHNRVDIDSVVKIKDEEEVGHDGYVLWEYFSAVEICDLVELVSS